LRLASPEACAEMWPGWKSYSAAFHPDPMYALAHLRWRRRCVLSTLVGHKVLRLILKRDGLSDQEIPRVFVTGYERQGVNTGGL
jgi:hypothetical protein